MKILSKKMWLKLSCLFAAGLTLTMSFQNCQGFDAQLANHSLSSDSLFLSSDFSSLKSSTFRNGLYEAKGVFGNGFAMSWDGRIVIRTNSNESSGVDSWMVSAIRPGAITIGSNGAPNFTKAFSPSRIWGFAEKNFPSVAGAYPGSQGLPLDSVNALAIVPDHDFSKNPYPSDANGNPSSSGSYSTYKTIVYTQDYLGGSNIGFLRVTIVVAQPNTNSSAIHSVVTDRVFHKIKDQNGQQITGIEPTVTFDGRLMIYQNHSKLWFTFNEEPQRATGWTVPAPITSLYSFGERMVSNGSGGTQKFKEIYRIAQYPIRYANGDLVGSHHYGAYPWINLDGDELFLTTTVFSDGAIRAGAAVVGPATKGLLQHIDGGANADRNKGVHRLFTASFGKTPGKWSPPDLTALPLSKKLVTKPMFLSNSHTYYEISFEETEAGDYDVYLPMNEALRPASYAFDYDLNVTQDLSGHFHAGTFQGAMKPLYSDDYLGCEIRCDQKEDRYSGKAIYFRPSGYIEIPHTSKTGHALMANGNSLTASFALKILSESGSHFLLASKENSFDIVLEPTRQVQFSAALGGVWKRSGYIGPQLPLNEWIHLTFTYNHTNGELTYYINGGIAEKISLGSGAIGKSTHPLRVGPQMGPNENPIYAMDQFALSPKVRSVAEIHRQVMGQVAGDRAPAGGGSGSGGSTKPSDLPLGLLERDQRHAKGRKLDANLVELGRHLFFDKNLSKNAEVSCATCHQASLAWGDGLSLAKGLGGKTLKRNSPPLFNMAFNTDFFHDGRASSLEKQVVDVILNKDEMDGNFSEISKYLQASSQYNSLVTKAFGSKTATTQNHVARALSEFMFSLMSGNSKHDRVIAGKESFTPEELLGHQLFNGKARCAECHNGSNFSDNQFHNLGFLSGSDRGRFDVTGASADQFRFKTPSLRNVELTGPYFHDGSASSLEAVVTLYNQAPRVTTNVDPIIQPLGLTSQEERALVSYMRTLTGTLPSVNEPSIDPAIDPSVGSDPEPNDCKLGSQTIKHGASISAYASTSVPYGQSCKSQTRVCSNGKLSGSYTALSCTALSANSCQFNGQSVAHGKSIKAYQSATVPFGKSCVSQTRLCSNGSLSGSYSQASCSVEMDSKIKTFIQLRFAHIIGRLGDEDDIRYYHDALIKNRTVAGCKTITRDFFESDEFKKRNLTNSSYVNMLYKAIFNRSPDSAGKNYWMGQLNANILTKLQLREEFLKNAEATEYCNSVVK